MSDGRLWIAKRGDKLPAYPAVYAMFGENSACLYVGSTVNLKSRIGSHRYRKMAVTVAVFPCAAGDLRDVEERIYRALKPSLNRASTIARSGYPALGNAEDFSLRLESCGGWWQWRCGTLSLGFRTVSDALDNWKKVKELFDESSIDIMRESARSLRQSTCLMWPRPVR